MLHVVNTCVYSCNTQVLRQLDTIRLVDDLSTGCRMKLWSLAIVCILLSGCICAKKKKKTKKCKCNFCLLIFNFLTHWPITEQFDLTFVFSSKESHIP